MDIPFKISVVIPTHNRTILLTKLLTSLKSAIIPKGIDTIYIVENGSKVSEVIVQDFKKELSVLKYLHFAEGNKSLALNETLKEIPGDHFIVFFDDDVEVVPDIFLLYVKAIKKMGKGHYYGGPIKANYEIEPDLELIKYMPASSTQFEKPYQDVSISDNYHFLGANWGAFKASLIKVNGFNNDFGPGAKSGARGQETDAQLRLFQSGLKPIYVPNALVYHWVPKHHLTKEWVMDRVQKSAMIRGVREGSIFKNMYWKMNYFWYGVLYFFFGELEHEYLSRNYLGYLEGTKKNE
jgi:glycosyltransferase involved in cell wall biosynthesis